MKQRLLDFPEIQNQYSDSDYIISESNQNAYKAVLSWYNWHHHCMILYGKIGCGKTHLANIWKERIEAREIYRVDDVFDPEL